MEIDGIPHWHDPARPPRRSPAAPRAYLFPTYDEVVLSYPRVNFPAAEATRTRSRTRSGRRWCSTRSTSGSGGARSGRTAVEVEVRLAPSVDRDGRAAVRDAAQRLADFLERDLDHREV